MDFCGVLVLLVGAGYVAVVMVRWIARPIEALAQSRQAPSQFTVGDMLVLFAMLQLAVGKVHYVAVNYMGPEPSEARRGMAFFLDAIAAVILLLCWWCGVGMVSRAGINRWWHRVIVLGFVVPCSIVSLAAMVPLSISLVFVLLGGPNVAANVTGILVLLLAVVGVCGKLTRWVAAKYESCGALGQANEDDVPQPRATPLD